MSQYHKIQGLFKRYRKGDEIPSGKKAGDFIIGNFSVPVFEILYDNKWVFKEKVDGTNCRIIINPEADTVELKGRTDKAQIPKQLQEWFDMFIEQQKDSLLSYFTKPTVLYGEGVGQGIQKGKHGFIDYEIILFDVNIGGVWLTFDSMVEIANTFGLRHVCVRKTDSLRKVVEELTEDSKGNFSSKQYKSTFGDFTIEGYVAIPVGDFKDRLGNRIITKLKLRDFL